MTVVIISVTGVAVSACSYLGGTLMVVTNRVIEKS